MTTNFHTAPPLLSAADAYTLRAPLGELDAALGRLLGSGTSFPGSPVVGDRFYRSDLDTLYVYLAGGWKAIVGGETVLHYVIDGGGQAISTGVKGFTIIPFDAVITEGWMLADQTGSVVVDVWSDTYTNYPPTDADTITAAAPLTISAAIKSKDTTLTGWSTTIAADDILAFNVDSAATITRLTIGLKMVLG